MDSLSSARKRATPDDSPNGHADPLFGMKKNKEMDPIQPGLGSKSKPCTKFFSTGGCPFGESCHFLHYVPGGYKAPIPNFGNPTPPLRRNPNPYPDGSTPPVKTRMCNNYNSPDGCKFGNKCHFAHGEWELGKPLHRPQDVHSFGPPMGQFRGQYEPPVSAGLGAAASFGASATAKISVDASLSGAIIGKGGVNTKQICRETGAKLAIRDHESDANLKNIELEGTFDQIRQASAMVRELILHITGGHFKTKLCEHFAKGTCTFGERCHFAHGENDLRNAGV